MQTHADIPSLLDVQPEPDFSRGHVPGSANIPLEELSQRTHELPPAECPLLVVDCDVNRAQAAAGLLQRRGHLIEIHIPAAAELSEAGPQNVRLWRPSPFLVEALKIVAQAPGAVTGRALDVACGSGREAVWLALAGYAVDAVDILSDALQRAADLARRNGVSIRTIAADIEKSAALPVGSYDLVTVFRFLHRPLFAALAAAVAPGGHLIYQTFHERNLATGRPPRSASHLLKSGELAKAFADFSVLVLNDPIERDGRFFAEFLACKPL